MATLQTHHHLSSNTEIDLYHAIDRRWPAVDVLDFSPLQFTSKDFAAARILRIGIDSTPGNMYALELLWRFLLSSAPQLERVHFVLRTYESHVWSIIFPSIMARLCNEPHPTMHTVVFAYDSRMNAHLQSVVPRDWEVNMRINSFGRPTTLHTLALPGGITLLDMERIDNVLQHATQHGIRPFLHVIIAMNWARPENKPTMYASLRPLWQGQWCRYLLIYGDININDHFIRPLVDYQSSTAPPSQLRGLCIHTQVTLDDPTAHLLYRVLSDDQRFPWLHTVRVNRNASMPISFEDMPIMDRFDE